MGVGLVLLVKRKFLLWVSGESDECHQLPVVLLPPRGDRGERSQWESSWVPP